ncbi:MAG: DUF4369 domain-containing protein [Bacteroidales bacterium]|nr:DUF4369 domain-containing protein [Bacteroidales bacterium]
MKRYFLLFAVLVMLFAGCKKENKFTIEGTIDNGAGKMMYIEELTPDGPHFLDSIQLDKKGNFTYKGKYEYQTFYNLHTSAVDYVVLLPYKGEKIKLSGVFDSLSFSYKIDGSKESATLWQLQDYSNYGAYKLRDIVSADHANRERFNIQTVEENGMLKMVGDTASYRAAKKETDSLYREAYDEQVMYITQFLQDNSGSLATLIALYKPFNGNHPIIDVDRYPELFTYYEQVLQGLEENEATADNPHTIAFKNVMERVRYQVERKKPQAVNFSLNGAE